MNAPAPSLKSARLRALAIPMLAVVLSACAAGQRPASMQDRAAARGHQVARQACAACHSVERTGVSPMARAPAFASLEMRHTASLRNRVQDLTSKGHYDMPPIPLRPDEVSDIVSYIASLEPR